MNNNNNPYMNNFNQKGSGDPFNQFNPMSQMQMRNMSMYGNMNSTFQPNGTMIHPINYTKPQNTLIHDNLNDDLLHEQIIEHSVFINSDDRDPTFYKDPFTFRVDFNPNDDTPAPYIAQDFRNVKYVKLNHIILPAYYNWKRHEISDDDFLKDGALDFSKTKLINTLNEEIDIKNVVENEENTTITTNNISVLVDYINDTYITKALADKEENDYGRTKINRIYETSTNNDYYFDTTSNKWFLYRPDEDKKISNDAHILMHIDELDSKFTHGTNRILDQSFGTILLSWAFNPTHFMGTTNMAHKVFKDQYLGHLKRLSIKFYNVENENIRFNHLTNEAVSIRDPRHPKHPSLQNYISFIIGVVDPSLNQKVKYER